MSLAHCALKLIQVFACLVSTPDVIQSWTKSARIKKLDGNGDLCESHFVTFRVFGAIGQVAVQLKILEFQAHLSISGNVWFGTPIIIAVYRSFISLYSR